ncbi:MAG: NUDIX hydrolase [Magnetococcales bacterium]|nr:NUDIX hydrolase [Magnetococcales bacterium]
MGERVPDHSGESGDAGQSPSGKQTEEGCRRGRTPGYPPDDPWDQRLTTPLPCPELHPVRERCRTPWFTVRERGGYYTIEHSSAQVLILPVLPNGDLLLLRVKRPVLSDTTLELPSGGVDAEDASVQAAALRELAEESGCRLQDPTRLVPIAPLANEPGRNPRLVYTFRAELTEAEYAERQPHDDEVTAVCRMGRQEVRQRLLRGEIYVSAIVALIGRHLLGE